MRVILKYEACPVLKIRHLAKIKPSITSYVMHS